MAVFGSSSDRYETLEQRISQEQALERVELIEAEQPKRKSQSYIWDTFDKSPEERRFLFKLDAAILTFASLGITTLAFFETWET